ncbi:hypothetical protein A4X13_0g6895 [Tilletia indica]|uniref:Ubiquitin-like protease family profile domain-containing protein n=1 Tax=Tilletia indica TaxID=43049 RepID=A0A177TA10_9BASI|nr:hypothetical protein A4X13_0g6895 [Tilletia indica]
MLSQRVLRWSSHGKTCQLLQGDLDSLAAGVQVNDAIIDFGLRYLLTAPTPFGKPPPSTQPDADQITILDTNLFPLLAAGKPYDKWTKNLSIFDKGFLVVPVHSGQGHWSLIIVAEPVLLIQGQQNNALRKSLPSTSSGTSKAAPNVPSKRPTIQHKHAHPSKTSIVAPPPPPARFRPYPPRTKGHPPSRSYPLLRLQDILPIDEYDPPDPPAGPSTLPAQPSIPPSPLPPFDTLAPTIYMFDSKYAPRHSDAKHLEAFMQTEALTKHRQGLAAGGLLYNRSDPQSMEACRHKLPRCNVVTVPVPQQGQNYDCALYLLHYVRQFFSHPSAYISHILNHRGKPYDELPRVYQQMWAPEKARNARKEWRTHIKELSDKWIIQDPLSSMHSCEHNDDHDDEITFLVQRKIPN